MEHLNYDCIFEILNYLDLKEHISLLQAFPDFFCHILPQLWQHQYKDLHINFYESKLNDDQFRIFMQHICGTAERVRFKFITPTRFEIVKLFKYPKVRDFRFSQVTPFHITDEDLPILYEIFPNLHTFSPHGVFSGKYFTNWKQMQHLTLSYCRKLKYSNFLKIILELQLLSLKLDVFQTEHEHEKFDYCIRLEKVFLNSYELKWLGSHNMKYLKNLKELTICEIAKELHITKFLVSLQKIKPLNIIAIETCNLNGFLFHIFEFVFFRNLQKLSFTNEDRVLLNMNKAINSFHVLREVNFFWSNMYNEMDLMEFLENCKQLEHITIEECKFYFPMLTINVQDIVENRVKPLTINLYNNYLYSNESVLIEVTVKGESDLLQLTYKKTHSINCEPLKIIFL